jgi:hypothetical protein
VYQIDYLNRVKEMFSFELFHDIFSADFFFGCSTSNRGLNDDWSADANNFYSLLLFIKHSDFYFETA